MSQDWFAITKQQRGRLFYLLEILLGRIYEANPAPPIQLLLEKIGVSEAEFDGLEPNKRTEVAMRAVKQIPTKTDAMITALELVFGQRYGWTKDQVMKLTVFDALLALEHALEYDDKSKPSIWEATK
jgi:hypothetical protein